MDKNSIIGFSLIALVLIGFSYFSQPNAEEIQNRRTADSLAIVERSREAALAQQEIAAKQIIAESQAKDSSSMLFNALQGENQEVVLQNELVKLTLQTKGGVVREAQLFEYKDQEGAPITLFDSKEANMSFLLDGKSENINTAELNFTPTNVTDSTVTMVLALGNGSLNFDYKLLPGTYMTNLTVTAHNLQHTFPSTLNSMGIRWETRARQQEKSYSFESRYATLTYKGKKGGTDYLSESKEETEAIEKPLDWVAFKNQFFSCVFIADQDFQASGSLTSNPIAEHSGYLKDYKANLQTAFDPTGSTPTTFQLYYGPNKYRLLQSMSDLSTSGKDLDLEQLVYLGWPLFRWINRFFTIYLFDFLSGWGLSMGVVLLLLTIIIKILVYPTTKKSFLSSARMRVLKPKVDELAKKYPNKEDAMKKQQETMALYSQYGVSPMGGCLPMMLQMPIWIALFNFIPNAIELRGESFLWAKDLSSYDDLISWSTPIWGLGNHLSIFCLLFCLTNVGNTWISMRQQKDSMMGQQGEQMKMMQYMMYVMPFMFFFMFNEYSSGLNYYYFISGLLSILIMWFLRKTTDDEKLLAKLEARFEANKGKPQKMSGLAARLEAMQKAQQAKMEEQKRK